MYRMPHLTTNPHPRSSSNSSLCHSSLLGHIAVFIWGSEGHMHIGILLFFFFEHVDMAKAMNRVCLLKGKRISITHRHGY